MSTARKKSQKRSFQGLTHPFVMAVGATLIVFVLLLLYTLPQDDVFTYLHSDSSTYAAPQNTAPPIAQIEAEDISTYSLSGGLQVIDDATASMGKAMMFSINTTATGSINLPTSASKLIVNAKGERCKGNPAMQITIGETVVMDKNIPATSWNDYSVNVSIPPGSHNVAISFTNDLASGNCDRSLKVDSLIFQ